MMRRVRLSDDDDDDDVGAAAKSTGSPQETRGAPQQQMHICSPEVDARACVAPPRE